MIDLPADRLSPGRTIQRGPAHMVVPAGRNGADFLQLFAHTNFDAKPTDDFVTAVWRKLCLNSAGAHQRGAAETRGHRRITRASRKLMRTIMRECIAVGRAEGAKLEDAIADDLIERAQRGPRDGANSMLADRRAGRPMEYDARNGVIVRLGRKHGIAAPMNALMVALLEAAQQQLKMDQFDRVRPATRGSFRA